MADASEPHLVNEHGVLERRRVDFLCKDVLVDGKSIALELLLEVVPLAFELGTEDRGSGFIDELSQRTPEPPAFKPADEGVEIGSRRTMA